MVLHGRLTHPMISIVMCTLAPKLDVMHHLPRDRMPHLPNVEQGFNLLPSPNGACLLEWAGQRVLAHGMSGRQAERQAVPGAGCDRQQICQGNDCSQRPQHVPDF
jgi:hypothetical protein